MQVQQLPIYRFLEGQGKSFVIPVYQRDYSWIKINCQKLWNDLVDLNNNSRSDHFLGTLVTIGVGSEEYTIIDGQQRLTTVSLLLKALHTFLKNKGDKTEEEKILSKQVLDFLINKYFPEEDKKIRLKPNKQDKKYFDNLFVDENIKNADSNIVSNYNFFYEKINSIVLSPEEIFEAFKKLKIVWIILERGQDNPQLIFESLNATGVKLKEDDKIRNFVLMDLEPIKQEKMYKEYWSNIEKLTGDVAEFVRNYLIFKLKTGVKKDNVYEVFKKFSAGELKGDKEQILKNLLYFAQIYSWFVQINNYPDTSVNKKLNRLNKLEFTVSCPYLLDVFNDLKNNILSEQIIKEILTTIESYAFRKILVDNTTQGLNKMFITLSKEIKKEKTWKEEYLNILKFILLEKRASQKFPNDEEFENALMTKEVYRLQTKNKNFLLESLEKHDSEYDINLRELTVEHIMPQTLTTEWKDELGENWEEIHNKYLHTLGNLTLITQNNNTRSSNKSFKDKKNTDYITSPLKLTQELANKEVWNENSILKRAKNLIESTKDIWPFPKTKYFKSTLEEQVFDLTSEDSFSGSKPSHLYFENNESGIELKTWRDLLTNICEFLHNFSPTQFSKIQNSQEFKWYFDTKKPLRHPIEFMQDKFVEGNMSANGVILFLLKICKHINYPAENISFSIKNVRE